MRRQPYSLFLFALLFLLMGYSHCFAGSKADSLKQLYQTTAHDTTKVNTLLAWGEAIYLAKPDSALILYTKARDLADKCLTGNSTFSEVELMTLKIRKADALGNMGYIIGQQGNPQLQLKYTMDAVKILENLLNDNLVGKNFFDFDTKLKKGLTTGYNNIGVSYKNQGEIDKALEYFFLSLKIREEIKDKSGMASSYNNIGAIYNNQGEIEKGLEYFFLSLKICEEIKDKIGMALSYNNIGAI
ncbi:tetratricopeptide repeat protein, partial [bacterium AH-315-C07]|nr:tetratricopeptide repeat protein [bacterium AH-315-C07]